MHVAPSLTPNHYVPHSQNRKLLRDVGRLNLQNVTELIHTLLTIAETVDDADSDRVGERLKEFSLEVGQLLWHAHPRVDAYSNLRSLLCQRLGSVCVLNWQVWAAVTN